MQIVGKDPKFFAAPIQLFDIIIGFLAFLGKFVESFEDAAELGRIGKYYAVEDMLTTKPEEKYGKITLKQHYERIAVEGQAYDPYTTFLGKKQQAHKNEINYIKKITYIFTVAIKQRFVRLFCPLWLSHGNQL